MPDQGRAKRLRGYEESQAPTWGSYLQGHLSPDPGTGIPPGKITRRTSRDGTPASDFAGFEKMRTYFPYSRSTSQTFVASYKKGS